MDNDGSRSGRRGRSQLSVRLFRSGCAVAVAQLQDLLRRVRPAGGTGRRSGTGQRDRLHLHELHRERSLHQLGVGLVHERHLRSVGVRHQLPGHDQPEPEHDPAVRPGLRPGLRSGDCRHRPGGERRIGHARQLGDEQHDQVCGDAGRDGGPRGGRECVPDQQQPAHGRQGRGGPVLDRRGTDKRPGRVHPGQQGIRPDLLGFRELRRTYQHDLAEGGDCAEQLVHGRRGSGSRTGRQPRPDAVLPGQLQGSLAPHQCGVGPETEAACQRGRVRAAQYCDLGRLQPRGSSRPAVYEHLRRCLRNGHQLLARRSQRGQRHED